MNIFKKIVRWGFKDELSQVNDELNLLKDQRKKTTQEIQYLGRCQEAILKDLEKFNTQQTRMLNDLQSMEVLARELKQMLGNVGLSVDVDPRGGSWAVISIEGDMDYVRFVDLRQAELREVSSFISRFERGNARVTIDTPPDLRGYFKMRRNEKR